ncbi:MAG: hypothetical protein NUV58_02500 [Candidatus Roizmanbacteria bacterium]|nr:hypothetical protein [Candidatus Roizmanbacteria bacterium]
MKSIRKRGAEILKSKAFFTAPCGEINPIELYYSKETYPYKCRTCKGKANYKMLFLSPKYEVEGDFGPVYFCQSDLPDINLVATTANYYKVLYGK